MLNVFLAPLSGSRTVRSMQARGSVMGDHNWDLSEAGWRELSSAIRDSNTARFSEWEDHGPAPSLVRSLQFDEAADALWDRGEFRSV